jgi:hypothetical protein
MKYQSSLTYENKRKVHGTVPVFKHELEFVWGNVGKAPHILNCIPSGDA